MPHQKSDRTFHTINNTFLLLFSLSMIAPIIHLAAVSLSSPVYANAKLVYFWPKGFNVEVYKTIFGMDSLWRSLGVSLYITVIGTLIALLLTSSIAYALSRPAMPGRKLVLRGIVVTFVFSVPLIPSYLLVKSLGMENTLWALMIPGALGAFNVIIMKTFFQGISTEVFDAAKIDGCSELGIFARIAAPLSTPVIATIALFHSVGQWNSYFSAIIFIRSKELLPLQVLLRNLVVEGDASSMPQSSMGDVAMASTPEMMKAGIILFATMPILLVYPFLQRYFVKGAMLGSLKE
jgi:putative aldouronate transport system permease protein